MTSFGCTEYLQPGSMMTMLQQRKSIQDLCQLLYLKPEKEEYFREPMDALKPTETFSVSNESGPFPQSIWHFRVLLRWHLS